jgi:predicted enzyme related to lactoylglutathione lyase
MKVRNVATAIQFVSDMDASKDWYTRFLGVEPTPYDVPYYKFGDHCYVILAPASEGTGRGGSGVWFEVEDVEQAYRGRVAGGFTFNEEPYEIPPGKLVTINDPDGNIVGLIDNSTGGMP